MERKKLPDLVIGDLRINPPIVQGGMGVRVSMSRLASAVANEGGLGVISSAVIGGVKGFKSTEEYKKAEIATLREEIRRAKMLSKGKGAIGVNIMCALTGYNDSVIASAEEGIDIIFSGAGLPLSLPKLVKGFKTKISPIISSGRAAEIMCKVWTTKHNYIPDAIVVEGPLAGGHLGFKFEELEPYKMPKLEDILVSVLEVVKKYENKLGKKIPVIAAGGIYDYRDIIRMLDIGADGVQIATRFICTYECDVATEFKQAIINAKKEDIAIIHSPVHLPGRAVRNKFLEKAERREYKVRCNSLCLKGCIPSKAPYCISDALVNAAKGDLENGFVFTGANAYRVNKIVSVKELMDELTTGDDAT